MTIGSYGKTITPITRAVTLQSMFRPAKTSDIEKIVIEWNNAPVARLLSFLGQGYSYGYIRSEDRTMYPLIILGAIVQIDEQKKASPGRWENKIDGPSTFSKRATDMYAAGARVNPAT